MKKHIKPIFIALFIILPLAIGLITLSEPPKDVSRMENRALKTFEDINLVDIKKGVIDEKIEKAITDQIIGRDYFIEAYSVFQRLIGKSYINNVYMADSGYLFGKPTILDLEIAEDNKKSLDILASYVRDKGIPFLYVGVPSKEDAFMNMVPSYIEKKDPYKQKAFLSLGNTEIDSLDLTNEYIENNEKYYYRTDHH